ncbi:MAG: hypothetical protein M3422_19005 [Actinomycetota bacterium]|nr:hypothetical protein [Actinomycetota bacterium]
MVDMTGSGVGESASGTVDAIANFDDPSDVGDVLLNAGTFAIDGLGFLANPVDALTTSVIGWVVEHLAPLRWPLDITLGDPEVVQNNIKQWNDAALSLDGVANDYANAPANKAPTYLHGNSQSAAALAAFIPFRQEQISGAGLACAEVAQATAQAAALVAATRGLIRDTIVALVWDLIKKAAAKLAFAPLTFGTTAAAIAWDALVTVATGLKKAGNFLASLLDKLKVLVANLSKITAKLDRYFSVARPVSAFGGKFLPNPTAIPKVALDGGREYMKADDTAMAVSDDADTGAARAKHQKLDQYERTTEERNAQLPPPASYETEDWWTRRGTLD